MSSEWPYTYEILDVDTLTVDESYQRPLTSFAGRIERGFDPALVGTLVVSRRTDGTLAVVDGQTRAAAIRRLASDGMIGSRGVPCLVYEGLSRPDEASLFARLQKERRGISSYHRFRAALVAGEEEAVAIQAIVEQAGHETGVGKELISAVAALEAVYRHGPEILTRTFSVLANAWGPDHVPSGDMLRGVGRLLRSAEEINDELLAERLKPTTPGRIQRLALDVAEEAGSGGSREYHTADALEAIYNGYETRLRPTQICKAPKCAADALHASKYCGDHAAMAAEFRRRQVGSGPRLAAVA